MQRKPSLTSTPWATQQARSALLTRYQVVHPSLIPSRLRVRSVCTAQASCWQLQLKITINSNSRMLVWALQLPRASRKIVESLERFKKIPTPSTILPNSTKTHKKSSRQSEWSRATDLARAKIWLFLQGLVLQQKSNRPRISLLVGKRRAWSVNIKVCLSLPQHSTIRSLKSLHLKSQRWMLWLRPGVIGTSWEASEVPHVMIEVRSPSV